MAQSTFSMSQHSRSEPFELQVARGQIPYHTAVNVFGYQALVGGNQYTVWENVADYIFPTTAATLTVASDSASDTSALSIVISGLDSAYAPITEVLALNGVTNVTSKLSYLRVASVVCTNGNNAGTVTFKQGSNIVAQINPAVGRNQAAMYTVPAGCTFYGARFTAFSNEPGGGNNYSNWRAKVSNATTGQIFTVAQSPFLAIYQVQRSIPYAYTEKTDVQWQVSVGTSTSPIGVNVEGILIQNNYP